VLDAEGVWRWEKTGFERVGELPPRPRDKTTYREPPRVVAFGVSPDGELWLGQQSAGLAFYPGGSPELLEPAYPFAYGLLRSRAPSAGWSQVSDAINPRAIAFDLQGRALIGSAQGEVHRWDGSSLRSLFERLPTSVSCLAVDGPGRLIIGTPVEAWVSDANGTKPKLIAKRFSERGPWGSFEGEAIDFVSLTTDSEGSVWGATADGLVARLTAAPQLRWESHNLGLAVIEGKGRREPSPAPTAIAAHPSGAILLSHSRPGLFCVKPA
jgi:ligand-binding sensor domain-containing protein